MYIYNIYVYVRIVLGLYMMFGGWIDIICTYNVLAAETAHTNKQLTLSHPGRVAPLIDIFTILLRLLSVQIIILSSSGVASSAAATTTEQRSKKQKKCTSIVFDLRRLVRHVVSSQLSRYVCGILSSYK